MLEQAHVIGLEAQLTVPSRNQPRLVDIWVSIGFSGMDAEWMHDFEGVAQDQAYRLSPHGLFQYVAMNEERGWIVARRVNPRHIVPRDVEAVIRDIVAKVNARASARVEETVTEDYSVSWVKRVRESIVSAKALLVGARPRTDAEVVSRAELRSRA